MTLTYQKATEGNLNAICALIHSAIRHMEQCGIFQWDALYPAKEDFAQDILEGTLYVGKIGKEIAAVYALNQRCEPEYANGNWAYPQEPFYVIHRLCVHPRFQHRGVAAAVLAHIEQQLRQTGIHVIRLDVFSQNPHALRLYQRAGYTQVGHAHWRMGTFHLLEKKF